MIVEHLHELSCHSRENTSYRFVPHRGNTASGWGCLSTRERREEKVVVSGTQQLRLITMMHYIKWDVFVSGSQDRT